MTEDEMNRIADLVVEKMARRMAGQHAPQYPYGFSQLPAVQRPCNCPPGTCCGNSACPYSPKIGNISTSGLSGGVS